MTRSAPRVLVTGGAGFLGRHLCHHLVGRISAGRIVVVDDLRTGDAGALPPGLELISADVRHPHTWRDRAGDVDLVIHLAALSSPRACERAPDLARSLNVDATAALLDAVGDSRFVLLSSAAVYRPENDDPLDENAPVGAETVYSTSKLAAERLCLDAADAGRVETVIVRNFNSYGEGQSPDFLVAQLMHQGLDDGHLRIRSCGSVRDFLHADDTASAITALALSEATGIFNVGTGKGTTVGEVALTVGEILGVPVSCEHERPSGIRCLVAATRKLTRATGWHASTDLRDGLERTAAWHRARRTGRSSIRI